MPIGSADYGAAWNWRIGASSKPAGDPANLALSFAPTARGLRPCGINLESATFKGTGSVTDLLRDRAFLASGIGAFADGWFSGGTIEWTSGANDGRLAEIMLHEVSSGVVTVTLLEAPVRPIAADDAFVIRAGCDKRAETCRAKFANMVNFRGYPHIPGQDAMIRYATKDGGHEGNVL